MPDYADLILKYKAKVDGHFYRFGRDIRNAEMAA